MTITTIGIDLAKNVFQIHGVDGSGKAVLKKQLRRNQVLTYFIKLTTCTIGMEACGGAHYWARKLSAMGHTVKLMAPQFVKPYVKANKTDAADAEAICEAVTRPNMRFVAIKNVEQQAILSLHRARQGFVKARTAQANQIRGLLGEYGITIPQGIKYVMKDMLNLLDSPEHDLPGTFIDLLKRLHAHLLVLEEQVSDLETQINSWHSNNEYSQRLRSIRQINTID
jgi:transposase